MTKGLIQDFSFKLIEATILITQGGSGSNSGLTAGFYIYFDSDIASNLADSLGSVFDHFASILSKIGVSKPKIPSMGLSLGLFLQTDSLGFEFNAVGITVKCIFIYSSNKGSCKFSDKYFTMLANAGKWVIKKAAAFFDESGDEIVQVAQEAGKFITNSANAVASKATQLANTVANGATSTANTVAKGATSTANTVTSSVKKVFKKW
jgi:hypothetical protein